MRLYDHLRGMKGDGLSPGQYRALKRRFPIVILNENGEPDFRDKPKTRQQAINWIINKRLCERFEKDQNLNDLPRTILLVKNDETNISIEEYLIQKFNINEKELKYED